MSRYRNPVIRQLKDQQVRYAPRDVRLAQIDRTEKLLHSLDPRGNYRYPDLCEKITLYRGELYPDLVITGDEAAHDLRCFVEDLSDSADIPVEAAGEEVLTVEDVSRQFNVSTKTVDRWRDRGLVSRRFRFGGRKRIGFLKSSVDDFVSRHSAEIERGYNFSQISDMERQQIIRRARRLRKAGGEITEISRRLARKFRRSVESIRYTIHNFDRDYPHLAVITERSEAMNDRRRRELYRDFRQGVSVDVLAAKYDRTRSSVYRILAEVRAELLREQPIEYIDSEEFRLPDAADRILSAPPEPDRKTGATKPPPGLPPYLASLYALPLLTREEEAFYFRKMNFLKFQAAEIVRGLSVAQPHGREMDQVDQLLASSQEVKNFLIKSNLRLVVSIAKRHMKPNTSFFEMVSDGNMSLIRAIEKFDYSKGFKFSTYASWAIMKNYARSIPAEHQLLDRFRTGNDELFQTSSDQRSDGFQQELASKRKHEVVMTILDQLDEREREIIVHRYGLRDGEQPQTLEQVGAKFGVTKERIRQLEARALKKLRQIADQENLEGTGF